MSYEDVNKITLPKYSYKEEEVKLDFPCGRSNYWINNIFYLLWLST